MQRGANGQKQPSQQQPGTTASTQQTPASSATAAVHHAFQLRTQLREGKRGGNKNNNTNQKQSIQNGDDASSALVGAHPIQVNLQQQLLDMFEDKYQSPILLVLGQKGGGKSFRMMTLIMYLIRNNIYDRYFFVLPTYKFEASNSYAWLAPFKDRVYISTEYTPEITQAFMDRKDDTIPAHEIPRTFLWLDDVGCNEEFRNDRMFVSLLSIARHKRLSVALCYHSLTSGCTLNPFLRQNVTHTLLFRVTNEKLLESIYEELISMTGQFERFKDFRFVYNTHTCSSVDPATGEIEKNFNGLCINNSLGCIDWEVAEWLPDESEQLLEFLDVMKEEMENELLPPPKDALQFEELEPEVVLDIKPKPVQEITEPLWNHIIESSTSHPEWFYNGNHRFLAKMGNHFRHQRTKNNSSPSPYPPPKNHIHIPSHNAAYGGLTSRDQALQRFKTMAQQRRIHHHQR